MNKEMRMPCSLLDGKPNENTVGFVGALIMDTSSADGDIYKCVASSNGKYTWKLISSGKAGGNSDVTSENIKNALGYTPADNEDVIVLSEAIADKLPKNQGSANVGKILVVGTDGNLTLTDMPEGGSSGDVTGVLDDSKNILLTGNLADGTYTLKWKVVDENGEASYVDAGALEVSSIVTYAVTQNLTNATSDNSVTEVRKGESIAVNLTANSGYNLKSITVTMGGADITSTAVSGGKVTIASVTGDVLITAVAEEYVAAEPTNFAEPNTTNKTDWSIWCNDARFGSDGAYRSNSGTVVTNYIPIKVGDTLSFEGLSVNETSTAMTNGLAYYTADKAIIAPSYWYWYTGSVGASIGNIAETDVTDGVYTITLTDNFNKYVGTSGNKGSDTAYVRIAGALTGTVNDVVIRVKRNGVWL